MVTIYAWLEIRATYLDEDLHPEIDEKKVFLSVFKTFKNLSSSFTIHSSNISIFIHIYYPINHEKKQVLLVILLQKIP